ncbi:MAG: T9SS type A sorting domain-containing protein [Bacteroidota bacterium]
MKRSILHIIAAIILMVTANTFAREFRVSQIPNGSKFGCLNCHVSSFGGSRNSFGQLVQTKYLTVQGDVVWGEAIAKEDADGDGVTNGQELQDPTGVWRSGQANPGISNNVTNPGDRNSKPTSIESEDLKMPTTYSLAQNYPNPFNPTTTISFALPVSGQVLLEVYDVTGKTIAALLDMEFDAGRHSVELNAAGLSSGIYFYRIRANQFTAARKFILMK